MSLAKATPIKKLTVGICTRNRARLLRGTLESLRRAEPPEELDWEVLVILNNCSDQTPAVLAEFADHLPLLSIEEPRAGVSHARNKVIENATGDAILWTEDDAQVRPGWLRAYERAFLRWPDTSVFGGPIEPLFEGRPPAWISATLPAIGTVFGMRLVPEPEGTKFDNVKKLPFGGNFAIRTDDQKLFPYDPTLGRFPGKWIRSGEETTVIRSVIRSGRDGRWVPSAVVDHIIPQARQTLTYVRAYYVGHGRTLGEQDRKRNGRSGVGAAIKELASVVKAEIRYRISRPFPPPERWARNLRLAAVARGRWIGHYLSKSESGR